MTDHWRSGKRVEIDDADWALTAAGFLGAGYRVRFPAVPPAVAHARRQATAVADLVGVEIDPVPWDALGAAPAYEIVGGWAYGLDRRRGAPWTAVTPVAVPPTDGGSRVARDLPWAWSSSAPTAGLPILSGLEERLGAEHAGADVGLWWDHRDLLCSSTAGVPLVQAAAGDWHTPDLAAGAVRSWAYDDAARRLGARPALLDRDLLAAARAVVGVSDLGVETRLQPKKT